MKDNPPYTAKRKATSQSIWIVVAIMVALIVALIVITLVNRTAGQAGDASGDALDSSASTLKRELCNAECKSCIRIYGDECKNTHWEGIADKNGCKDITTDCG